MTGSNCHQRKLVLKRQNKRLAKELIKAGLCKFKMKLRKCELQPESRLRKFQNKSRPIH